MTVGTVSMELVRRLVGPMFDKELRVASRRRRHYMLRFAYIALLAVLIARIWESAARRGTGGSAVVQISRLSEAGKQITVAILWFQFITGQILAAVLLSDAIGGEIRHRTFDTLLVTPMGGLRIVMGKLLSRLLQLVLLLAISLPLLALVRVFGGVPWDFLVSGICVTLTATLFAGALSLLGSIFCRKSHEAFTLVGLWYLVVYGIATGILGGLAAAQYIRMATVQSILLLINPLVVMADRTTGMLTASGGSSRWPYHCLIMLAAATVVIALAVWRVRRITLASILRRTQQSRPGAQPAELKGSDTLAAAAHQPAPAVGLATARPPACQILKRCLTPLIRPQVNRPIRRVRGAPVVWKESRQPILTQNKIVRIIMGLVLAAATVTLVGLALYGMPEPLQAALGLVAILLPLLFMVRVGSGAAGAVTREKEARTWPILLACPLDDAEIVRGKVIGVLRQAAPLLIPVPVLFLLASLFGQMKMGGRMGEGVFAIVMSIIAYIAHAFFLLSLGMYLSTRLKTTSTAVAATLGSYFGVVFFCCCALGPLSVAFFGATGAGSSMVSLFMTNVLHVTVFGAAGFCLMTAAKNRLRRDVFGSG